MRFLSLLNFLLCVSCTAVAQTKYTDNLIYSTSDSISNFDYSGQLEDLALHARILGLGEATHGTLEFEQTKAEIVKLLVSKYHYRHIIMEAGFPQSTAFNAYIQNKNININRLMTMTLSWPYATKTFLSLLNWLKEYNKSCPENEKVSFHGMDIQGYRSVLAMRTELNNYGYISGVKDTSIVSRLEHIRGEEKEKAYQLKSQLKEYSKNKYADPEDSVTMRNIIETQLNINMSHGGKRFKDRERMLYEYAIYTISSFSKKDKFIIWAHNDHVSKEYYGRTSLGYKLKKSFGPQYKAIGFEFNSGQFRAYGQNSNSRDSARIQVFQIEKDSNTLGCSLSKMNKGVIGISLRENKQHYIWNTSIFIHSSGAFFDSSPDKKELFKERLLLHRSFDYLFIVDKMHPTVPAF